MPFVKAVKAQSFLRLGLSGPAGSGKTYTALSVATSLADGKSVAVIDTERGSASKYSDLFDFDVLELETFHPQKYVEAIHEAVAAGYGVVVIDSLSHAWNGKGGILEIVQRKGNSFQAWGEVKPIEAALIEAVTGAKIHVIATMRSKTEYVVEKDERTGKSAPRKVGTAPIQRDGLEYEFDVFGELDQENTLMVQKSRCPALAGSVIVKPGRPLAETLRTWLSGAPAPTPAPAPKVEPASYGEDTITYELEDDEPVEPVAGVMEWHPLEDPKFVTSLQAIGVVNVADQEAFVAAAQKNYPDETVREACKLEYAKRFNAQKKATRRSQVSTLGATSSEPVPDSLESLPTGARAS